MPYFFNNLHHSYLIYNEKFQISIKYFIAGWEYKTCKLKMCYICVKTIYFTNVDGTTTTRQQNGEIRCLYDLKQTCRQNVSRKKGALIIARTDSKTLSRRQWLNMINHYIILCVTKDDNKKRNRMNCKRKTSLCNFVRTCIISYILHQYVDRRYILYLVK